MNQYNGEGQCYIPRWYAQCVTKEMRILCKSHQTGFLKNMRFSKYMNYRRPLFIRVFMSEHVVKLMERKTTRTNVQFLFFTRIKTAIMDRDTCVVRSNPKFEVGPNLLRVLSLTESSVALLVALYLGGQKCVCLLSQTFGTNNFRTKLTKLSELLLPFYVVYTFSFVYLTA